MTVLQEVVEVRADLAGRAPAAQLPQGRIEVDQPQHLCRREPERGDEALEASPDPGRAVGDEEHLVKGTKIRASTDSQQRVRRVE